MVDRRITDIGFSLKENDEKNESIILNVKYEYDKKRLFGTKAVSVDETLTVADNYVDFFNEAFNFDCSEYMTAKRYAETRDNLHIIEEIAVTGTPKGDFFIPSFLIDKERVADDILRLTSNNAPEITKEGKVAADALSEYVDVNDLITNMDTVSRMSAAGENSFDDLAPAVMPIWSGPFSSRRKEQENIVELLRLFSNRKYRDHVASHSYNSIAPQINAAILRDFMSAMNTLLHDQDAANELIDAIKNSKGNDSRRENVWPLISESTKTIMASKNYVVAEAFEPFDDDVLEEEKHEEHYSDAVSYITNVREYDKSSSLLK